MPRKTTQTSDDALLQEPSETREELDQDLAIPGAPQTDPEPHESPPGDTSEEDRPDPPILQTEPELDEFGIQSGPANLDLTLPQTEPEPGKFDSGPADPDSPVPQTEPGPGEFDRGPADPDSPVPQTEPEEPQKKRSRSKKREEVHETGADESQSGVEPVSSRPARQSKRVVSIDEDHPAITQRDQVQSDLLDLVESLKAKKILTGTIQGVERSEENPDISYAVLHHGAYKIIIPPEELVAPPEDYRGRRPADVMRYLITKRLGAEIDYVVKGVDPDTAVAVASRMEAMAIKRRMYYYGTDRDGNNVLYAGCIAEARVISVIRAGIFIDLCGVEVYIPLKELSYQRIIDATAYYQPGQRILVKILELECHGRDNIQVTASVKQAAPNPYEEAMRKYSVGNCYVGTVSLINTTGVFVNLSGIDCLCSYPKRGRPPRGSQVTVRILGVNKESNRIWGAIIHMSSR